VTARSVADEVDARGRTPEQIAHFLEKEYAVPAEMVKDKQKVTIRFQATGGNETGACSASA